MTSKANAYEVWVLAPLTAVAVAYNITQLIPCIWLPQNWNQLGYPSDLFLLLHQRTTVTTQVLREALTPEGSLSALAQTWLERFGGESIDRLLWRLSSVDGRVRGSLSPRNSTLSLEHGPSWRARIAPTNWIVSFMQPSRSSLHTWPLQCSLASSRYPRVEHCREWCNGSSESLPSQQP